MYPQNNYNKKSHKCSSIPYIYLEGFKLATFYFMTNPMYKSSLQTKTTNKYESILVTKNSILLYNYNAIIFMCSISHKSYISYSYHLLFASICILN